MSDKLRPAAEVAREVCYERDCHTWDEGCAKAAELLTADRLAVAKKVIEACGRVCVGVIAELAELEGPLNNVGIGVAEGVRRCETGIRALPIAKILEVRP